MVWEYIAGSLEVESLIEDKVEGGQRWEEIEGDLTKMKGMS